MAVSIIEKSASISIAPGPITPDAEYVDLGIMVGQKWVPGGLTVFCLANGKAPRVSRATDGGVDVDVGFVKIDGHVEFSLGPGDTLAGWKAGFVQIAREPVLRVRYSGRTPTEGSIVCDAARQLGIKIPLADSKDKNTLPWVDTDQRTLFTGGPKSGTVAAISFSDHVWNSVAVADLHKNELSPLKGVPNLLYDFRRDVELWTMLTVMDPTKMDPTKALRYLGYVHWRIVHKWDVLWRSGAPLYLDRGSSFQRLDQDKGAPTDADLQPILKNPAAGRTANDVLNEAYDQALGVIPGADFFRRAESDDPISPIRPDFWGGDLPPSIG
jgi:hypothetical protein